MAEPYHISVSKETEMPFHISQAGMFFPIQRSILNGVADIPIQDHRSVQGYFDMVADGDNFFLVPFAYRLQITAFGGNDPIDGTVVLINMKVPVYIGFIVQYLYLHTHIG